MSGLRFCMVTTFYPPHSFGGDGVAVQALARALVRRGHHVTVICDEDAYRALAPSPVEAAPEDDGVTVHRLRSRVGPLSILMTQQSGRPVVHGARIRRLIAEGDFDVVHFHNVSLVGGPGILDAGSGIRLYTAHEHWLVCPTHVLWRHRREPCAGRECFRCALAHRRPPQAWRYTGFFERQLAHVDAFIAMSEFSRAKHAEFGFPRPMEVIPGFLADVERAPRGQTAPYFLFAGRLEPLKGLEDVIPIFDRVDDASLVIAGEGTHRAALERLAAGNPRIRFIGQQPRQRLAVLQRDAVAAIMSSRGFETFGLAVIEAFAQGTPVIARRVGPLPELVDSNGAGETFDTTEELETAIRRLLDEPGLRDAAGTRARAAFVARYREDVVLPQYLELVERVTWARGRAQVQVPFVASDLVAAVSPMGHRA